MSKVKYSKLDQVELMAMEEGVAFSSSSGASSTAFVPLSESGGIEPSMEDKLSPKDSVDGFGDFESVGVSLFQSSVAS